jgi:protein gp37
MADKSKIEWTDSTWNPIVGCTIVSPGCTNCYAMKWAHSGMKAIKHYDGTTKVVNGHAIWTGLVRQAPEHILMAPLKWKKPRRIFVNSMSDLFHEDVPDEWIDRVFAVMALCPQHVFQVLTKRSKRMREYMTALRQADGICGPCMEIIEQARILRPSNLYNMTDWPLSNVWLGVSCEDQARADERIPDLLATPAAVRFVSAEPLLGPIDFARHIKIRMPSVHSPVEVNLDWIIVGGESGSGSRHFDIGWARSIINQCKAAGVACFVKQLGSNPGTSKADLQIRPVDVGLVLPLKDRKGGDILEWPEDLRVRQMP